MEGPTSDLLLRPNSKPVHESHLDLLSSGTLSDVIFIVGSSKERIPCHRAFLIARSPVFKVMFSERWNQGNNDEVSLKDVDAKVFKKFLQFVYADVLVANVPEALELLQLADRYDVQLLVSKCEELLENEVTLNDAVDVFQAGGKYDKNQLMDKAADVMAQSLSEFRSLPSFSRVDKKILLHILKKKGCIDMKEIDLFRLAVQYAHNQSNLTVEQSLEDILPLIRFPAMSLMEFTSTVVPMGLLSQSTLAEVFTYFKTDGETKQPGGRIVSFNPQRRRSIHSVHHFCLYLQDMDRKKTKLLKLEKLQDCLQISTCITESTAMGLHGISIYCPFGVVSTSSRPASSTFKEFKIVLKHDIMRAAGPYRKILLSMSPVKAEEGKMTEVKFGFVVPLENFANYRIIIEEILPTRTELAARREDFYVAKVFGPIRNCEVALFIMDSSVIIESQRNDGAQKSFGDIYEHPQLICRFALQKL